MANVADDGSSSLPESASGVASHHEARGVRYVAHNFPDNDDDAESTIRSLLEPDVIVRHCQLSISGKHVKHASKSFEFIVSVHENSDNAHSGDELTKSLEKLWCQRVLSARNFTDLWLETTGTRTTTPTATGVHRLALRLVSLGAFTEPGRYVCHWKLKRTEAVDISDLDSLDYGEYFDDADVERNVKQPTLMAGFEYDNDTVTVSWTESTEVRWRMEIPFDSLADRVILMTPDGTGNHLYIFVVNQPKVYRGPKRRGAFLDFIEDDEEMVWERDVCFGSCNRHVVGSSNAIHLKVDPLEYGNVNGLLQRLSRHGFSVYAGSPRTVEAVSWNTAVPQWPRFDTFEAIYAWYCLVTRGYKVTDQKLGDVIEFLQSKKDEVLVARLLYTIGDAFDNHCVVSLCSDSLERQWETLSRHRVVDDDNEDQQLQHLVKVRRLLLTPTVVRALPAEHIVGNRVVREFGVERFVRVVLRDEDMELLSGSACSLEKPIKVITTFLRRDLAIGDRRYHFLGCSNSQMREHGFWMYASDGRHTVDNIRQWMGDLSHERCVATYVSRLGQFFSASKKAVNVDERSKRLIPDVERDRYCFTDGIGKISNSLSQKVATSLNVRSSPSAFQIRYGGCKGVVSVWPDLEDDQLHVRKSMEKFKSDHHELEVVTYTKPGRLHLNRQVIVLMSGLGVPDKAFFALQDNMLQRLADMLIRESSAVDALAQIRIGLSRQQLLSSGICVTKEPFLSSILHNIYEHKLNSLMKKTRIEMSTDDGRIMMGTADETGSLCYGEVFVQYSLNVDGPQAETKLLEGKVVIAKNPCFHPGDLRKFTAVNKPQLKHMVDCVVFPTLGSRPHPDEMSGSDLDGDMYFVCWHNHLFPPGKNKEPMNYQPKPKRVLDRPVTESDIIDFIGSYIEGDKLGVIANSHLAHADGQDGGIFSQQCLDLAQMHSDAVDFPKTGYSVKISADLRPRQYPHYMLKRDKPIYISKHVLGKLYDQCQSITSNRGDHAQDLEIHLDDQFLTPGYEDYLDAARTMHDYYSRNVTRLMSEYGISTEAEIVTGHIIKLKKQRRGTLQREHVEIAEIINSRLKSIRAKVKEMFFEELGDRSSENSVELSRLASAVYFLTYSEPTRDQTGLSLPWIFVDHLLSARKLSANPGTMSTTLLTSSQCQSRSVLHQLSREVLEFKESDHRLQKSRMQRSKAFKRLLDVMSQVNDVHVVLSVFGSHATGLDDTTSSLDVYVDVKSHKMSQDIFDQIMNIVRREYSLSQHRSLKMGLKPITLSDDVNGVQVCLYTSVACIRRTVYIVSAVANNAWIIPVLQMMLSWAKQNKITGNDRSSAMTAEQLILLFLSYFSQNVADCQPFDTENGKRVTELILQNHFANCTASTCTHAKKLRESLQRSDENTNQYHDTDDKCADVILNFLNRSSRLHGEVLKEVIDPACEDGETKLFNFKGSQYHRLAERMLKAYHTLAQSGHFVDLAKGSKLSDGHLLVDLPQQVSKRILLTEKSYADKLKRESNAEMVAIRRRPYRDSLAGLVLEAWGSLQSLQLISDLISDEANVKPRLFAPGGCHYAMENSYITIFKNCSSASSLIVFQNYLGPCQPNHDQLVRHRPRLVELHPDGSFSQNKFVERSLQQVDLINSNYDENVHGNIRAVVSYGTLYVANCNIQEIPETDFDGLFSSISKAETTNPDLVHPRGRGRSRGRRPRGRVPGRSFVQKPCQLCRASFIPAGNQNIDITRLQAYLQNSGFVLAQETVDYRLTLKLNISGKQLKLEAVVALDENFNLKYVNMPDYKWLCVSVVSPTKDSSNRPYDCRFKIQSRTKRTVLELRRESDDFADVVANHRAMLLRTGDKVYGVHPDFSSRIRFVRKKHTRVYKLAANQHAATTDAFLYGVAIRINYGTEYSRPSSSGLFQYISPNRVEITAVPAELPNLHDEDAMRTFLNRTWEFAEELGSILD